MRSKDGTYFICAGERCEPGRIDHRRCNICGWLLHEGEEGLSFRRTCWYCWSAVQLDVMVGSFDVRVWNPLVCSLRYRCDSMLDPFVFEAGAVVFLTNVFREDVPDSFLLDVLAVIEKAVWCVFHVHSDQMSRVRDLVTRFAKANLRTAEGRLVPMRNVWFESREELSDGV